MIPPFTSAVPDEEIAVVLAATEQVLRSGRLVLGPHTDVFESGVAAMAATRHAVAVSSGATALEIIFRHLRVRDRIVLVPTNTNYATAAAALAAGARVELYDSGLYPSLDDLRPRLDDRVAAVVVVHIGGYLSPQLPLIASWCRQAGVALVEDAAHAQGSTLAGRAAGGFGVAAAFSFFATKVVTTGEGGAITTDDPELATTARIYRDQGKNSEGLHVVTGGSWRITELGAALGHAELDHLDRDIARREAILDRYTAELTGTGLEFPTRHGAVSGHKAIAVACGGIERVRLAAETAASGVQLARGVYEQPLHRQPVFADILNVADEFPVADEFADRHVCLPLWRGMSDDTVSIVIETVGTTIERLLR